MGKIRFLDGPLEEKIVRDAESLSFGVIQSRPVLHQNLSNRVLRAFKCTPKSQNLH